MRGDPPNRAPPCPTHPPHSRGTPRACTLDWARSSCPPAGAVEEEEQQIEHAGDDVFGEEGQQEEATQKLREVMQAVAPEGVLTRSAEARRRLQAAIDEAEGSGADGALVLSAKRRFFIISDALDFDDRTIPIGPIGSEGFEKLREMLASLQQQYKEGARAEPPFPQSPEALSRADWGGPAACPQAGRRGCTRSPSRSSQGSPWTTTRSLRRWRWPA